MKSIMIVLAMAMLWVGGYIYAQGGIKDINGYLRTHKIGGGKLSGEAKGTSTPTFAEPESNSGQEGGYIKNLNGVIVKRGCVQVGDKWYELDEVSTEEGIKYGKICSVTPGPSDEACTTSTMTTQEGTGLSVSFMFCLQRQMEKEPDAEKEPDKNDLQKDRDSTYGEDTESSSSHQLAPNGVAVQSQQKRSRCVGGEMLIWRQDASSGEMRWFGTGEPCGSSAMSERKIRKVKTDKRGCIEYKGRYYRNKTTRADDGTMVKIPGRPDLKRPCDLKKSSFSSTDPEVERAEMVRREEIKYWQDSIETQRQMLENAEAKLSEMESQNEEGTFDKAIASTKEAIATYRRQIEVGRSQLKAYGGSEKEHHSRIDTSISARISAHRKEATRLRQKREANKIFNEARMMAVRFSDDEEHTKNALKTVERLRKKAVADPESAKNVKEAFRKIFYESSQIKQQAETVYQTEKALELDKKTKRLKTYRRAALMANKYLAKADPTGIGDKIVEVMEDSYALIDGLEKGGEKGAMDMLLHLLDKRSDDYASVLYKEYGRIRDYYDYTHGGYRVKKSESYYDENGNRLEVIKKYQHVYDKNGRPIDVAIPRKLGQATVDYLESRYNTPANLGRETVEMTRAAKDGRILDALEHNLNIADTLEMGEKQIEGAIKGVKRR